MCSGCIRPYPDFRWEPPIDPPADDPNELDVLFDLSDVSLYSDEELQYGY